MDNAVNCIAPMSVGAMRIGAQRVGAISWTAIFTELIKQGFSTFAAEREADRRYQLALAQAQKEAAGGGTDEDDKTQMYLLIGGAVLLALMFMK